MQRKWMLAVAVILMVNHLNALGDWKSALVRTAVGNAARAGIQEAVEDAVKDRAFDATLGAVDAEVYAVQPVTFGENAGAAVEAAMTAADVAATLDRASEVAEAAQKINRARKAVKTIKR